MKRKVERSCKDLLFLDKAYLVALSGGADSVALLRVLLSLNYRVEAVHCNFHLRGDESDRDEQFCKDLCRQLNVPLHLAHFDTKSYSELHKVSIEMAARTLRYDYFHKLIDDLNFEGVCVAHHRDDSVETVLLNMVRGAGLEGLRGISSRNGKVLRPMLDVSKSEIIDYLKNINQDFITDSTNLVDEVQRNKVRLNIIPELRKINTAAEDNIQKMSSRVEDALLILNKAIHRILSRIAKSDNKGGVSVKVSDLLEEPGSETLLWYLLKGKGFLSSQVEQIFERISVNVEKSGSEWLSSTHAVLLDRGTLFVQEKEPRLDKEMLIPETGVYNYDEERKFAFSIVPVDDDFEVSRSCDKVCFDADKLRFPLLIRPVRNADKFVPFGMKGKKLVSDFLTDKKISLFEKRRQLVIEEPDGNLIWLVGLRPDNRYCITDESKHSLVIEIV